MDRTFSKASNVRTRDYAKELPRNAKRWFGSATFSKQLDLLITEIIKQSILYADGQMKVLSAAAVAESHILTEEAVRISGDLSAEVAESIVRMLKDDAIYYQHPTALARKIQDLWGKEKYRADRFAQTFTADVATATTVHRYRQYNVIYMEFDAEQDDRTTDQCKCLDGTIFDLSKDSVDQYRPPLHMHCLVAGTKITTPSGDKNIEDIQVGDKVLTHLGHYMPVTETMTRFPEGLLDLFTSSYHVRITPNHPILQWDMYNGVYIWVEAGKLKENDLICTANGYEFVNVVQECEPEQVFNIAVQEDESYTANGIVVHNCRSGLKPVPGTYEVDENMIFEKRDFSGVLGDPAKVDKAFQNIGKFNDKYRISKYVLDQDLAARIMFEKGAWVGVNGPAIGDLAKQIAPKLAKSAAPESVKTSLYSESKTIKEAETWVKANTQILNVDYAGLDVKTANAMNEALARHLELHPELAGKIKYYGTAQGQATLAYKLDLEATTQKFISVGYDREKAEQFAQAVVSKYRIPSNNVAHYWRRTDDASGIAFNKNAGKHFDRLEENLKRDVGSGFHPEGCDSVKSMIDHEFGHALDDVYGIKSDPAFVDYYQALSAGEKAAAVSRYGATNADEFIAEAWAEYTNNPTPRPAAKLVGDLITSKIK